MVTLEAVVSPAADPDAARRRIKARLAEAFGFDHATVEICVEPATRKRAVARVRLRVYLDALSTRGAPHMPIKIPAALPAHDVLRREGVMVMSEETALRQDIRPLQIGLLNLMPKKVQTETQFARVIGATPLQIELTLIRMSDHEARNTSAAHLEAFYQPFRQARERRFDGLIITGAPDRAPRLRGGQLLERAARHLRLDPDQRPFHHGHLLGRHGDAAPLPRRPEAHAARQGVRLLPPPRHGPRGAAPPGLLRQLRGAGQPLDRGARRGRRSSTPSSSVLIHSDEVGPCLIEDRAHRAFYMFNHLEYDSHHAQGGVRPRPRPPAARSPRRSTTSPTTIRRSRRRTAGAATASSSTATGSTRSTRPRPTSSPAIGA